MNKTIVGLVAKGGCGKSTVADIMVEDYGFTKVSFASALKEEVALVYHFPEKWCHDQEGKNMKISRLRAKAGGGPWPWGNDYVSVRDILQYYGTDYMRKKDPDHWCNLTEALIDVLPQNKIVLDDVRFPNELRMIERMSGISVRMEPYKGWAPPEGMNMRHESEIALDKENTTFDFWPKFGMDELKEVVENMSKLW
jgi:hypothetical protein